MTENYVFCFSTSSINDRLVSYSDACSFYLNLPANGVTGIALHLLSMWMMPVMWDALLILLAYVMMVIAA